MKASFTKDKSFLEPILGCLYSIINNLSNIFLLINSAIFLLVFKQYGKISLAILLWIFFLLFFLAVASVLGKQYQIICVEKLLNQLWGPQEAHS